jgi:hypothetical protein
MENSADQNYSCTSHSAQTDFHIITSDGLQFWTNAFLLQARKFEYLHAALNIVPIRDFIYHLTATFFGSCPAHPNPLISSIGNYTLADPRRQYTKYIHKRPKHILL